MMNQSLKLFTVATLAGALAACGGSGSSSDDAGSTGTVSFDVTDAPAMEFSNVTVSFTGISLKPQDGEWVKFSFDTPKTWNLLDLQGGMSEPLITDEEVPAGPYSELRLLVDTTELASFVTLKDQPDVKKSLAVPSGEQSGLKLKGEFLVAADTTTDFTIDFDVKKSIVNPQGQSLADYLLKPSLRLVSNLEVGSISGEVDYATINQARNSDETQANCTEGYEGSAYVYQGADVIPSDLNVNNEEGNPLMVVPVSLKEGDSLYSYKAAFLTEGDYTISYSCQVDDNEVDDEIEFDGIQNVTVEAGIETEAQTIPLVN